MQFITDRTARELARGASKLKFKTKWSAAHEKAREGKSMIKAPRVVPYYGHRRWAVRMTHGTNQFDLAIVDDVGPARRISDMALVLLWPYRIRDHSDTIPAKLFNFSEECARMDIANEPDIYAHISKVHDRLLEIGALTPLDKIAERRTVGKKSPGAPKVGAKLQYIADVVDKHTESHTTQLIHTRELTKGVTTAHGETLQVLTALTGNVDSIREELGRISDPKEAIGALAARVVNVQQLFGALNETHKHEMQALQSRLAMLEGKIQSQGEWLSDFSKRNMALDAKMGTVVQLLQVITQRLNASPTTVLSAASAAVQSDKLSI